MIKDVTCPRCGQSEIELEVTYYSAGRDATFNSPPEGAEIEYKVIIPCDHCGFNSDDLDHLPHSEMEELDDQMFEAMAREEEAQRDREADHKFEQYREGEIARGEW